MWRLVGASGPSQRTLSSCLVTVPSFAVLREALTRDEVTRRKKQGEKVRKGKVGRERQSIYSNVHHFRDDALIESGPPIEHVVIFDEAQRALEPKTDCELHASEKKRPGFSLSEPEFLISYMDRHQDWALIICLVGGGQEINTGEAGIDAWLDRSECGLSKMAHVHLIEAHRQRICRGQGVG